MLANIFFYFISNGTVDHKYNQKLFFLCFNVFKSFFNMFESLIYVCTLTVDILHILINYVMCRLELLDVDVQRRAEN